MRWSWGSFVVGAVAGAAMWLLLPSTQPGDQPAEPALGPIAAPEATGAEPPLTLSRGPENEAPTASPEARGPGLTAAEDGPPAGELPPLPELLELSHFGGKPGRGRLDRLELLRLLDAYQGSNHRRQALQDLLVAATRIAKARLAKPRAVTRSRVAGWLKSDHGDSVLAGVVLAMQQDPPLVDELAALAGDPGQGLLRAAALVQLVNHPSGLAHPATEGLVAAALRDADPGLRSTGVRALSRLGERGVALALVELARRGLGDADRDALAAVVARSPEAARRLSRITDPAVLIAVLRQIDVGDAAQKAVLAAELPGLLARIAGSDAFGAHAGDLFKLATSAGRVDLLGELVLDRRVPRRVREAAIGHVVGGEQLVADRQTAIARLLTHDELSTDALLITLRYTGPDVLESRAVAQALWELTDNHADALVRERARERLQVLRPGDAQGLRIVKATYGKAGKEVDVTTVLRAMVVRGRLTIVANNQIAGDPNHGVTKDLIVVYEFGGRRFTRSVSEGRRLAIP